VEAISDGVSMAAPQDRKGKALMGLDVRIDNLGSHGEWALRSLANLWRLEVLGSSELH
jgi:hypothetical protein